MELFSTGNIIAGNTLALEYDSTSYKPSDGYSLNVILNGLEIITITATVVNDVYIINVPPTTTKNWIAGVYTYVTIFTKGTDEYTEDVGRVEIELRVDLQATGDKRSNAQRILDSINAVLEKRATSDQMSYSIAGRSLSRMSIQDLLQFKNYYQAIVKAESGKNKRKIYTRM